MKLTNLSLAALILALSGPAFAQTACTTGLVVGADGACEEAEPEVTTPTTMTVDDPDNPGATIEVEVPEPEPTEDLDAATTTTPVAG